jgi:putative glutamine transport system permease protein
MDFAGAYSLANLLFLLKGFAVTLMVAAIAIFLSLVIGCVLAVLRYARVPLLAQLTAIWVDTMRNLPLLLLIFFAYFALPKIGLKMNVFVAAITALTVFESAMISEIIRAGLVSIEKGQIEAARSSGLSFAQTLRYIILPQALRRMVPPLISQCISLLKDTSLAVIIALPELMNNAQIINGQNVRYVVPIFIAAAFLYFVINYSISLISRRWELSRA